jgi:phosphoribosylglycinamide formyltransferase-1
MADGMRIAMLISGGGTTAAAIYDACKSGALSGVTPACVIASSAEAGGISRLASRGMPEENIHVISPGAFASRESFGEEMLRILKKHEVNFVGQYGWLIKTPENIIEAFPGMMTNQHPGPLDPPRPDFGGQGMFGRRVHAARILFVQKTKRDFWSEATAQRVGAEFDAGKVIIARRVPIFGGDNAEDLQARMLPIEHEVQIETLRHFAAGTVPEFLRTEPLVHPEEEGILKECKQAARAMYPEG